MDPTLARFGPPPPGPFPIHSHGNALIKTHSGCSSNNESPVSAAKVAAAHNAQMGERAGGVVGSRSQWCCCNVLLDESGSLYNEGCARDGWPRAPLYCFVCPTTTTTVVNVNGCLTYMTMCTNNSSLLVRVLVGLSNSTEHEQHFSDDNVTLVFYVLVNDTVIP